MQAEERKQNEEKKRKEYYANKKIETKDEVKTEIVDLVIVKPKETLWNKIKNMLGSILRR